MEVSDAAWRAVLASIDRYESGEALLEALLSDQPLPDATTSPSVDNQREVRALVRSSSTSPSSSSTEYAETETDARTTSSAATTTTTVVAPTKKRRRVPQTRPKEEIDRLRESFAELTALLELLQQRQAKRPCDASRERPEGADTLVTARVWKAVAGRQYQYLRDSQAINEKLRMQLRVQMNIIQSFVRLIKRAQAGFPTILVPQSLVDRQTSDLFGTRRGRLLDAIDNMASELEITMQADPFTRAFDGDFREVWVPPDGTELPGNALLATSSAGYLAPRSQRVISERWWERIRKRTSRIQDLHFKHVDRGEHSETVSYSVGFATAIGSATYSGLAMSRRVERQDGGIVFLGVHELCPTESTCPPMTGVEYCMETVSLILPFQGSHSYSQVVVKTTGMRLEHPLVPNLSEPQVAILRRFVTDTLDFLHVQLQQQLDVDIHDVSSG